MIWDISPIAFTLSIGPVQWPVRWYGLLFAASFVYGIYFLQWIYRREDRPVDDVHDLALYVVAGTLLGARLGHVLFYDPAYYLSRPWSILAVWEGGLASHGALVGILLSVWLYSRRAIGQPFLWIMDRIALAMPLTISLVRVGNFFNSEILGHPSNAPWAVIFTRVDALPRHPAQLYEALVYLLIFALGLRHYLRRGPDLPEGRMLGSFLVWAPGARFLLEFFKEEQAAFASGWALTMGQWLSLPVVAAGAWLLWRAARMRAGPA
jgi:prolipoprotein diacylglyceryl transferase